MYRLLVLIFVLAIACSSGRSGTDRPGGMTGTGGAGGTTGVGTAAPTGTVGTGGTADPASPGAVIPKEGESIRDPDDSAITQAVIARLKEAGVGNTIEVDTDEGVVTLKGTASSQEQIEQIIKMVQKIPDVESVTSELTIR